MSEAGQEEMPGRPARHRWLLRGVAAAAVVALLAGVAYAALRPRQGSTVAEPSGAPTPSPSASPTPSPLPEPGADITGPLNILLVGIDTRISVPSWQPHADAVMIMHIPEALDRAYLFSLPRDLIVEIPAFPKAQFSGQRTKLTHAMSYGSRVPGKPNSPDTAQGLELLATTVSSYTKIRQFDAAAVVTFQGLQRLVDALGGVDLYIDQRVVSRHRQPNGKHRAPGHGGYVGPQMVYEKGMHHLTGWQAVDYARQRYITGGTYARERHHQQLIKAIVGKLLDQELVRDPARLGAVLQTLGKTLTFDGGDQSVIDFAFALSGLRPEAITLVSLPGYGVGTGNSYRGEELNEVGRKFIAELRAGRADTFLAAHPDLVVPDPPPLTQESRTPDRGRPAADS
ncbi:MAG TPA: LCP family protein [Micromonospora sp.]|nr:LCP family protein [Micromonospora sp.]